MERITTIVRGLLVLGFGLVGSRPASAQAKGIEFSGFGGLYAPTATEGLEGTREALRRGSLAFGGRLTYWTGKALGLEFTGAFSPARIRVSGAVGQFPRSTAVALGSGKVMLNLTPGSRLLGIALGGGIAGVHAAKSVADRSRSQTDIGGVADIALRLHLGDNVALRADFEDYFYNGNFGRGARFTQDLIVSAGLSLKF